MQPRTPLAARAMPWPPFKHNEKVSIIIAPALAFAHSCAFTHGSAQGPERGFQNKRAAVLDGAEAFGALRPCPGPHPDADPQPEGFAF